MNFEADIEEIEESIELTPLVDVIFQLLVFFMLSSSFLLPALDIQLPTLTDSEKVPESPSVVLSLEKDGVIWVQTERVEGQLEEKLKHAMDEAGTQIVFLRADGTVPYSEVLHCMHEVGEAGAAQINFIYEGEGEE